MAELLVRVVDKSGTTLTADVQCTKRGDVIVAQPDGWGWGRMEQSHPHYRIIKAPALSVSAAQTFCVPEAEVTPQAPSRMLQRRQFRIDLDHDAWPDGFAAWLADETRSMQTFTVPLSDESVSVVKRKKSPVPDPSVFGSSPKVVG